MLHTPDHLSSLVLGGSCLPQRLLSPPSWPPPPLGHLELVGPVSFQAVALGALTPAVTTVEGPEGYRRVLPRPLFIAPRKATSREVCRAEKEKSDKATHGGDPRQYCHHRDDFSDRQACPHAVSTLMTPFLSVQEAQELLKTSSHFPLVCPQQL